MTVTVLIQGDHENPALAELTEQILADTKSCQDVSTVLRVSGIDAVVQCPHRNTMVADDNCLF